MAGLNNSKATIAQYNELINLLTDRQDIAHGISRRSKEEINAFWEYVGAELNKLGPPTKDPASWRKVWADYKVYIRKKLHRNKNQIQLNDNRLENLSFLNDLENRTVKISGLDSCIKRVNGRILVNFDDAKNTNNDNSNNTGRQSPNGFDDDLDDLLNRDDSVERSIRANSEDRLSQYDTKIEESISLLKTQISVQKNVFESISTWAKSSEQSQKKITNDLKKIYRGVYRSYLVQKGGLREMQRHNKEMERLMKRKIEIKEQLLQLKKSKHM